MNSISVSIVLYKNNKKQIANLLSQLSLPCLIVDNSPEDNLKEVCKSFSSIIYLHIKSNLGFGQAHNLAFKQLKNARKLGKYHLILNPDIYFNENILHILATYLENHENTSLISPKILNLDNSLQYQCRLIPSPLDMIKRRLLNKDRLENFNKIHELHISNYDKIFKSPFIQGSFWLVRSDIFEQLKGFDERFFLYMEDVDFCRRLNEISNIIFYPHASVKHEWKRGSKKSLKLFALHVISMIKYFNKWGWFFDEKRDKLNEKTLKQFS
ncbi:MAG: glycosyl transferase family 2 [Proteobacteria bacterium]|nr:MAG: glycosyl transferase family 2 [Pseudomonadota bacterium]